MGDMSTDFTPAERRRLAALANVHEQYLYQCLTGRRDMNPAEARRCEDVTDGALRRWALCQKTWHLIWPELIGAKGAPAAPETASGEPPAEKAAHRIPEDHPLAKPQRRFCDAKPNHTNRERG